MHSPVFAGNGHGDLAFQVKLILTTYLQLTAQLMPGSRERLVNFATAQVFGWQNKRLGSQSLFDINERGLGRITDFTQGGGPSGSFN